MADVLSQEEISGLLDKIDEENTAVGKTTAENNDEFTEKYTGTQLHKISSVHQKFARLSADSLSKRLGTSVQIIVASICQLSIGDFYRSIPIPTTLGEISIKPLNGNIIFEIDHAIIYAIINIIKGGIKTKMPPNGLTTEDETIIKNIYKLLLENLRQSWTELADIQFELIKIEPDPNFINIAPPSEGIILITLEAKIENTSGMLNICIPYPTIETVMEKNKQ
jgi:flagellar motor switch protein FliM